MYKLIAIFQQGHEAEVASSYNPSEVIEAESKIAHDPKIIRRIEVRDLTGVIRTLWDASWENLDTPLNLEAFKASGKMNPNEK